MSILSPSRVYRVYTRRSGFMLSSLGVVISGRWGARDTYARTRSANARVRSAFKFLSQRRNGANADAAA